MEHHCPCLHQLEMQDKICIFLQTVSLCMETVYVFVVMLFWWISCYLTNDLQSAVNIAGKVNEGFYHKTVCSVRIHGLSICSSHKARWIHSHCQIAWNCEFKICEFWQFGHLKPQYLQSKLKFLVVLTRPVNGLCTVQYIVDLNGE